MEEAIQTRLTRVESDVKHIIEIVTDVKVELRRTNDKIDSVNKTLTDKIESVNKTLTEKIDGLKDKFDDLKGEMASMKVWAIGLYVALAASLLFVMAKGFHWL